MQTKGDYMARTLKDEEERNKRVLEIALYVKQTKASTRQTAKYFTEHRYPISNATVSDYLKNRLPDLNPILAKEIATILNEHTPKTIETVEVRKRIYSAVSLLFQDYTIREIADILSSTVDIIYDDLTSRLPKIETQIDILQQVDDMISEDVKNILHRHKMENLVNQAGNQSYFDKQYFQENEVIRREDGTFESFSHKK
jgi:hypothetical protein